MEIYILVIGFGNSQSKVDDIKTLCIHQDSDYSSSHVHAHVVQIKVRTSVNNLMVLNTIIIQLQL